MTKSDYFKRAVEELNLDTSDPFTLLFANACALLDQRDALKAELAALDGGRAKPDEHEMQTDAQAMSLVKKFPWQAFQVLSDLGYGNSWKSLGEEFNRAIVERVAKSDTPRTDAEYGRGRTVAGAVSINFARQLESDRARLVKALRSVIHGDDLEKSEARALLRELGEV